MIQKEYSGFGSIKKLRTILAENNPENIFLVTGKNSYKSCGVEEALNNLLKQYNVTRFSDFENNTKIKDVKKGIKIFRKKDYDTIVAVGGGSVIDMAKLIKIFAAQTGNPLEYIKKGKEIEQMGKPLVAIPTTAGSGSEATHFAVVYVDKKKYSIAHEHILPNCSIIDPELTTNLAAYTTAATGMDALSQAIESYWSVNSTGESKKYSKKAIKLIINNIVEAVNNPLNKSRESMLFAANLAGKAINITKTTAPHAISYPMTSNFGIAHGHAVSLTLGETLVYNNLVSEKDIIDKRGIDYVKKAISELNKILDCTDANSSKNKITKLMQDIGLKTNLSDMGIGTEKDFQLILNNVDLERLHNNPRSITKTALKELLEKIL